MTDRDDYLQNLLETNLLRESILRSAIEVLNLPEGSHGLDAGCSAGLQTPLLSDAVDPGGRITGLDLAP